MKPKYIIISCILICSLSAFSQTFSSKELQSVRKQTDSILNLYMKYATFTVDGSSISTAYTEGFKNLFTSPEVVVLNDLDPTGQSPKEVPVQTYINFVDKMYPTGLSIDLYGIRKGTPKRQGNDITIEVDLKKDLLGFYMDRERYNKVFNLKFFLTFTNNISQAHISRVASFEIAKDSLDYRTLIREADQYFHNEQYDAAKEKYTHALLIFSNATYPRIQVRKCTLAIEKLEYENRKPIYLIIQVHPAFSSVSLRSNDNLNPETKSGFGFGGGIGFEMDLFQNNLKSIRGGFGIGIYLNSMKPKLLSDSLNETVKGKTDIDGDSYDLLIGLQNINEKLKITCLDIPIYFQTKFGIGNSVFLNVKIGLKVGLAMSTKYNSTANGDFRGRYPQYNNIILYGNELGQFGYPYGTYDLSVENQSTESVNSLNLSFYGALGIGFRLSEKVNLFANFDYAYGLSNLFKESEDDFHLSENKTDLKSLGGYLQGNASLFGLELGLQFRIF